MKDPKMKLAAEILAQRARDRYENWVVLLQRWATILKNSEDYDVKKDRGQIQANLADTGHLSKDSRVKDTVTWAKCVSFHLFFRI